MGERVSGQDFRARNLDARIDGDIVEIAVSPAFLRLVDAASEMPAMDDPGRQSAGPQASGSGALGPEASSPGAPSLRASNPEASDPEALDPEALDPETSGLEIAVCGDARPETPLERAPGSGAFTSGEAPGHAERLFFRRLFDSVHDGMTLILRGAPEHYDLLDLPLVSACHRFIDSFGREEIRLAVDPWNTTDAERRAAGFFHTDFSQSPVIPDIIGLRCDAVDPRHPHFGRNQTVSVRRLADTLKRMAPGLVDRLSRHPLPFRARDVPTRSVALFLTGTPRMRYHPSYLDLARLDERWVFDGRPVDMIVEEVSHALAQDFVLDRNDIFFCSNSASLHRRGEASVTFGAAGEIRSRRIATRRYLLDAR